MVEEPEDRGAEDRFTLQDVWAIVQMQHRVVIAAVAICLLVAVVYSLVATRYYSSNAVVHLASTVGQEIDTDRVTDDRTGQWNRGIFVTTQIAILQSRSVRLKVLSRYQDVAGTDDLKADDAGVAALAEATEIKPRQGTELVDITVTTSDRDRSALLANLIAEVFRDESLAASTEAALGAKDWLADQIEEYETRIADASAALVDYEREHDMADADEDRSSLTARMENLNVAYGLANTERVVHETKLRDYERLLRSGNYAELAKEMNTPLVASLMESYAQASTQQARVAAVLGEKMPERRSAEAELERIDAELRAEVERTLSAERAKLQLLRSKEDSLAKAIEEGKTEMLRVQGLMEGYDKHFLALQHAKEFYQRLKARMGELELQSKTQLNRVRILEEARPARRASYPNVPINVALGLVVGLALGIGGGLLREWFDDSISSPLDVSTYLRVRLLGIIPKIEQELNEVDLALHSHRHPRSTVAEAVRGIRTVLELSPLGEVPRRILVTSAVSSEGKTSTVVRLAIAFANMNKRVVIIDADLRRPRVHKIFQVERTVGFTSIFSEGMDLESTICKTEVPNLYFVPAGPTGERPNELLASPEVPRILDRLSEQFDLVLIDSPPTVLLSDARILSRYVDGVVVIVREHATSRGLVREGIQGLEQVGARLLGVVINAVDFNRRRTSYKYYYGYGYRYDKYYTDDSAREDAAAK